MTQRDDVPETLKKMRLRLALFDSDLDTAGGFYWTWHHPEIVRAVLDKLYYDTIAPELTGQGAGRSFEKLWGGLAAIDQSWCCWYRLFDGRRDKRGRGGRYLILAALCPRSELAAIDPTWMLTRAPFRHFGENPSGPDSTVQPADLALNVQAPVLSPLAVDPVLIERLRRDGVLQQTGPGSSSSAALVCNHLDKSVRWSIAIRGAPERPNVEVKVTSLTRPVSQKSPRTAADLAVKEANADASHGKNAQNVFPERLLSKLPFELRTVVVATLVLLLIVETVRTGLLLFPRGSPAASVVASDGTRAPEKPTPPRGEQAASVPGQETTRTSKPEPEPSCFWRWAVIEFARMLRDSSVHNKGTSVQSQSSPNSKKQDSVTGSR